MVKLQILQDVPCISPSHVKAHLEYKAYQSFTKFPISPCAYTRNFTVPKDTSIQCFAVDNKQDVDSTVDISEMPKKTICGLL